MKRRPWLIIGMLVGIVAAVLMPVRSSDYPEYYAWPIYGAVAGAIGGIAIEALLKLRRR